MSRKTLIKGLVTPKGISPRKEKIINLMGHSLLINPFIKDTSKLKRIKWKNIFIYNN